MKLYLYDLASIEQGRGEAIWEMTVDEYIEANNDGDYERNTCIYIFTDAEARGKHIENSRRFCDLVNADALFDHALRSYQS